MKFKAGDEVYVLKPGVLVGTVVRSRPGDAGQPEESTHYIVKIHAEERYCLSGDLLSINEDEKGILKRYSPEWLQQFNRMVAAAQRWTNNHDDTEALKELSEAGQKIGWIKPLHE